MEQCLRDRIAQLEAQVLELQTQLSRERACAFTFATVRADISAGRGRTEDLVQQLTATQTPIISQEEQLADTQQRLLRVEVACAKHGAVHGKFEAILAMRDWLGALVARIWDASIDGILDSEAFHAVCTEAGTPTLQSFCRQRQDVKDAWERLGHEVPLLTMVYLRLDYLHWAHPTFTFQLERFALTNGFAHPDARHYADWNAFWLEAETAGIPRSHAALVWAVNGIVEAGLGRLTRTWFLSTSSARSSGAVNVGCCVL